MNQAQQKADEADGALEVNGVLRRKLRVGQEARQAGAMSLAKALRLSLASVADKQMGLALAVLAIKVEEVDADALEQVFDDAALLMLLDGNRARRAAAVFDTDLVGGLIQQQTMGKVLPPLGGDPRAVTDTDAAICTPYIEGTLAQAAQLPDASEDRSLLEGYRFGARMEEVRLLLMALGQAAFTVVRITVDLAGGARQGRITLCLPRADETDVALTDLGAEAEAPPEPPKLDQVVLGLKADLYVALSTLKLPLGKVQGMAAGDVFDLGITAFDGARVQTKDGRHIASGMLGQIGGTRALQLEHSKGATHLPRRRQADRATLNLPNVEGDGTGTRGSDTTDPHFDTSNTLEGTLAMETAPPPNVSSRAPEPVLAEMPDMSDLPELDGLSDLADLPDMSDLPGLNDTG